MGCYLAGFYGFPICWWLILGHGFHMGLCLIWVLYGFPICGGGD